LNGSASDQLEPFEEEAVEKADAAKIQELLGQLQWWFGTASAPDCEFSAKNHQQCSDGVHLSENACDRGDGATDQKARQSRQSQQGQPPPRIAPPLIQPLKCCTNVGLQPGGLKPSHGTDYRGRGRVETSDPHHPAIPLPIPVYTTPGQSAGIRHYG